jgi:hypothetical protein
MKLYTRWTHTTLDGRAVPIPIGVSATRRPPKEDRVVITVNIGSQIKVINSRRMWQTEALKLACEILLTEIDNGTVPGRYWEPLKQNFSERYNPALNSYSLTMRLPCLERQGSVKKELYLGTPTTRNENYPKVLQQAITLRKQRYDAYTRWFKQQLNKTIQELYENE